MAPMQIVCPDGAAPLIRLAVSELQRYVRLLFGFHPLVGERVTGPSVQVGGPVPAPGLAAEEYRVEPRTVAGHEVVACLGGSPRATLWAVYELIEQWGVHYLIQGDVLPEDAGPFHLPRVCLHRQPVFARRGFRVLNDMANSGIFWSLADHQRLFAQLSKLRFNAVLVSTYPHQLWTHWSFRGVERRTGGLCYGYEHPVHPQTIGRERFGAIDMFTNPDFQGARTYEDQLAVGQRFLRGLIDAAHDRGLEVNLVQHFTDFPPEFLRHLPAWTEADGIHLPEATVQQPQCARLGLAQVGGDPALERYRSPLNPVYVDMVESWFLAHAEAYPDVDCYGFTQPEFPPGAAGLQECWEALDARYDLERRLPLAGLAEQARSTPVDSLMPPARMVTELHGAIQTLRLLDQLLVERQVLSRCANPRIRVTGTFMSEYAHPLVPLVLPADRFEFMAIVDYLPRHVAQRLHTLAFARQTDMPVSLITTIEDDNVGFFPQQVTPSLHRIVQGMRAHGLQGFWFRQFDISPHEPAMYYMARAAWDPGIAPDAAYRDFSRRVCGAGVAPDLVQVFHQVEELEQASNDLCGVGFLMPNLYSKLWQGGSDEQRLRLLEYARRIDPIERAMAAVTSGSITPGRPWAEQYGGFLRFAAEYARTVAAIIDARSAYGRARERQEARDFQGYGEAMDGTVVLLREALKLSEQALRTWNARVTDATDLGTLAALNAYGHDYLRGLAWQIYLESQFYGFSLA